MENQYQQQSPVVAAQQHQYPSTPQQPQQQQQQPVPPSSVATPTPTPPQQQPHPLTTATNNKLWADEEKRVVATNPSPEDEASTDGRYRNVAAIKKIRDAWIYKQIRLRKNEFTNYRQATVYVGTWNVNAKGKEENPLDKWICPDWSAAGGPPDIVVGGFQEIVDLNAVNVAVDNKTQLRTQFWTERLAATLNQATARGDPNQGYSQFMSRSMVGLLIVGFVKNVHRPRTRHLQSDQVGVGVMGLLGNKGGVSIRCQFYDSTMCFVCTHLAAHRENVTGRNDDYRNVLTKTTFDVGKDAINEVVRSGSLSHWSIGNTAVGVLEHDMVFWLGDLNYRIDESMMTERVLQLSEKRSLAELRPLDQLNIVRAAGDAFEGFQEGPLSFPPTYKYQPGTELYEQRPDKKLRAPAWCDRILWLAHEPQHVQQLTYGRSESPNVSDHKPVYSTLRVTIKDVVSAKREAIYKDLMRVLDSFENSTLPCIGLDNVNLDFGTIRYGESRTLKIQITNTGSVVAPYRLVPKLEEPSVCKPWMSVTPAYGLLLPGEQPATMEFTITIDNATARSLNSGNEVLDDILILRLENGRDYYITVKANYARSCFGMDVNDLVMCVEPVRVIPLDPIKRAEQVETGRQPAALCVPKELWRTVDAVYEKGLHHPGLLVAPGLGHEVASIRECLDTGEPFGQFTVHSYAEVLMTFLQSLSTPIVPKEIFPSGEQLEMENLQMSARRLLEELAPIHYNIFIYMISFFREVLAHRQQNMLSPGKLAQVCGKCLAPQAYEDNAKGNSKGIKCILIHLLETSAI